jgi:hypothetical protein
MEKARAENTVHRHGGREHDSEPGFRYSWDASRRERAGLGGGSGDRARRMDSRAGSAAGVEVPAGYASCFLSG